MTRKDEIRQLCEQEAVKAAKIVGMATWYEQGEKVLTLAEKREISTLWDTMPGTSSWNDAFLRWIKS